MKQNKRKIVTHIKYEGFTGIYKFDLAKKKRKWNYFEDSVQKRLLIYMRKLDFHPLYIAICEANNFTLQQLLQQSVESFRSALHQKYTELCKEYILESPQLLIEGILVAHHRLGRISKSLQKKISGTRESPKKGTIVEVCWTGKRAWYRGEILGHIQSEDDKKVNTAIQYAGPDTKRYCHDFAKEIWNAVEEDTVVDTPNGLLSYLEKNNFQPKYIKICEENHFTLRCVREMSDREVNIFFDSESMKEQHRSFIDVSENIFPPSDVRMGSQVVEKSEKELPEIGDKVSVYWKEYNQWYIGMVVGHKRTAKENISTQIEYEFDGKTHSHNLLAKCKWKYVDSIKGSHASMWRKQLKQIEHLCSNQNDGEFVERVLNHALEQLNNHALEQLNNHALEQLKSTKSKSKSTKPTKTTTSTTSTSTKVQFFSDSSEEESKEESEASPSLMNKNILKTFDGVFYVGKVQSYDSKSGWYTVLYEDGDEDEMSEDEVRQWLLE